MNSWEDIFKSCREQEENLRRINLRRILENPVQFPQIPQSRLPTLPFLTNVAGLLYSAHQNVPDLSSLIERQGLQRTDYQNQIDLSSVLEGRTLQQPSPQNLPDLHLRMEGHNFLPANHQNPLNLSPLLREQGLYPIHHPGLPDLRWVESWDTHNLTSARNRTDEHSGVMGLAAASAIVLLVLLSLL